MLFVTLVILAILFSSYIIMSTRQLNHINRPAVAMFSGVIVWVVLLLQGEGKVTEVAINKYIDVAVQVILFLIASSTIIEIMNNNGVFNSLKDWLRTKNTTALLWHISLVTFLISANVDNYTTVVLMITILNKIVASQQQRMVYSCVILVSANLGGSFTAIGDMTSLMLWVQDVITPSSFAAGLFLPTIVSLCVFNFLASKLLVGQVEITSIFRCGYDEGSYLASWQKVLLLIVGIAGLWSIPTFSNITQLPPFLGALSALALVWVIDGVYNYSRNGKVLFYHRQNNTDFIGVRLILYLLGMVLGVGALVECGALNYVAGWLTENVHDVYIYGIGIGALSSIIDNLPFVFIGTRLFPLDQFSDISEFAVNGSYWQILSYCSALGGSMLYIGSLAGHAAAENQHIHLDWYMKHILWRVLLAWGSGMCVFYLVHSL